MRLAVVGDPIHHSRSPAIHTAALGAMGLEGSYIARRVPADEFDHIVADLRSGALDGVNVTMPHKDRAYEASEVRGASADRTHAVNTLLVRHDHIEGHNTDVDGIRHALATLAMGAARVVILGTGAAARAAVVAAPADIAVMGRSSVRAGDVLRSTGTTGDILPWGADVGGSIVVNATPLGMRGESLPAAVLASAGGLVDMAYGVSVTPAIAWARTHGLAHADGIDMLVGQAATAFTLFTGLVAPLDVMERAARR